MWYALQTSLSLEQEPHYWQEKSTGFQGAIENGEEMFA